MSYQTTEVPIFSMDAIAKSPKYELFDSVDADVLKSYQEYSLASLIFYTMKENACSEQSARMTAMDNASKNAGTLILIQPLFHVVFLRRRSLIHRRGRLSTFGVGQPAQLSSRSRSYQIPDDYVESLHQISLRPFGF